MKKFFLLKFCLAFVFLTSCSSVTFPCLCGCSGSKYVSVLNETIDQSRFASVHVNAPDPIHELNPHGQRIYVSWSLPKKYKNTELRGVLKIRFNVPEQVTIPFKIDHLRGTMTYQSINEEFFAKEGIQAYRVEIYSNGEEVDIYQHSMWNELISFDH